jgi:2-keto-4-pentenoate hydratase/2-oxohepta-3-ene-1,7-dioic acid hydratase in catechol pathway
MKICRFDESRVGVVADGLVYDVTSTLDRLPHLRWPVPRGDQLVANLAALRPLFEERAAGVPGIPLAEVALLSPVANPCNAVAAPINYAKHIDEAKADKEIAHDRVIKSIADWGLFLKSNSSVVGCSEGVEIRFPDRRTDHEAELAVVIGAYADRVSRDEALQYVAGYCIGLDMTLRGPELPSWRKSVATFTVLGPWLVTADEVPSPGALDLALMVNGAVRQKSNTAALIYDVPRLIEYASGMYPLYPGDVILTGTPEGVGPVQPGDVIDVSFERLGSMQVRVR